MQKIKYQVNSIEALEIDYLFIKPSQINNSGNGLFTAIPIYKDEIISVFKGELLTEIQAKRRIAKGNDKYFINLLNGTILDSMKVPCFAKYANDAEGFQKSNFKNNSKIAMDDKNNVCIIATKNILANKELFCSYGKAYWKKHS